MREPAEQQPQSPYQPPASTPASATTSISTAARRRSRTNAAAYRSGGLVILLSVLIMLTCPLRQGAPGMAAAFVMRPRHSIGSSGICSSTQLAMSTRTTSDTKPPPAASTSTSATPNLIGALPSFSQLLTGGRALLQECLRVAQEVGPRAGISRTLSATKAFSETARDLLVELRNYQQQQQQGGDAAVSPFTRAALAKSMRQLFERLGATYIKVSTWGGRGRKRKREEAFRVNVEEAKQAPVTHNPFSPPPPPISTHTRSVNSLPPAPPSSPKNSSWNFKNASIKAPPSLTASCVRLSEQNSVEIKPSTRNLSSLTLSLWQARPSRKSTWPVSGGRGRKWCSRS